MKKLMAIILTIAIVMSLCVVPASAAGSGVTITITPDKDKVDTATGDVIVTYTIKAKVTDPNLKVGALTITLDPGAGLTLADKDEDTDSAFYYQENVALKYDKTYNKTGIFGAEFSYAPLTKTFVAVGTTNDRNLNSTHGEVTLMTIMGKIAKGTTGSVTLKTTQHSYGDPSGASASVDCDVTPATVTILKAAISSVTFTLADPTQGAALPSLSGLGSGYTGAVEWYEGTGATGTAATGNAKPNQVYTAKITLTAKTTDGESFADSVNAPTGYTKVSADATTIVLTKTFDATGSLPAASVTAAPTAKTDLKYNGSEQDLLGFVGNANGGTMQYSLDNATWSTAIPKGKDAKTYTVYYMVKGDSSHSDSAVANIQVTIDPKDISTATIDAIANQSYTGSEITPDIVVKDGTTPLVKGTDYTVSYTKNKYVGTNTATLTITGKGNYTGTKSANFTIVAADQNPTFTTPKDLVKGGAMLDLRTLVQGAKGDMIFTIASGTAATLSGHTLTSTGIKGEVKVSVSITAKDVNNDGKNEYNAFSKSEAITVNVVDKTTDTTTMKVSQSGCIFGDTLPAYVLTNKPTATGTETVLYTGTLAKDNSTYSSNTAPTEAGSYTIKVKYETATTIFEATNTFTISPKSISGMTVTLDKTSLEYNGSAQSVTVTGVGSLTTADYTVTGATSGTNVGNYTVTVAGKGNYTGSVEKTWKITPATLTVTPEANQSKKFNEADPALTYTFSGNASGQTPAFSGKLDREAGENVGTYAIKLGDLALKDNGTFKASNYTLKLSSTTVKFEIKKADARTLDDITYNLLYTTTSMQVANVGRAGMPEDAGTLTYAKGAAPMLVPIPGSTAVVGVMDWNVDSTTGTVKYQLTAGSVGEKVRFPVVISSTNYEDSTVFVEIKLINKDDVSGKITFHDGKLVYNGNSQKYEKATISIAASGTAKWTYDYLPITGTSANLNTDNLPLTVGKYTVVATYEDDTQFGTKSATLEITPAKPTGTPTFTKITEKGKTLANANLGMGTLTPTGGTLEWVAGDTTVVEANKAYEWKYTPANPNYAPVTGTIVVYPVSTGIVIYSPCYTIKASAGANGTISPAGWCSVVENGSQTFTFTPDKGYTVAKVLVDGKSVGAVKSYTFKNVTKDHTIEVIFMKSNGNPATGVFVMP